MKIFSYIEVMVRIKKCFSSFITLSVPVVTAYVPCRTAAISIGSYVVGNICYYKLGFGDSVALIVLKVVII